MRYFRAALFFAAAAFGVGSTAHAADMPVKAPAYKAVPYWSWNGFYAGINAGYGAGSESLRSATTATAAATGPFNQAQAADLALQGGLFGFQLGYNVQMQNWLAGIEADYQFGRQSGRATANHNEFVLGPAVPSAMSDSETARITSFGTLRGRLGWITAGNSVWYATGGLAWGRRELTVASTFSALAPAVENGVAAGRFSDNHIGWVIGGGVESRLAGNWSAKLEYLYMDLGKMSVVVAGPTTTGAITTRANSDFNEHIVRAGLNYKFAPAGVDGFAAYAAVPDRVVASSGMPSGWTGFYAGINAGYGIGSESLTATTVATAAATGPFTQSHGGDLALRGGLLGLQFGYNVQIQNWLAGIEADYQFGRQSGSSVASHNEFILGPAVPSAMSDIETARIKSFGTLRGRLGWITAGNFVWYGTGGLAWGQRELTVASTFSALAPAVENGAATRRVSDNHVGWVLGGGVESRLSGNWSAKLEYLYMDLGKMSVVAAGPTTTGAITTTASSGFREHIVRAGLNYKLN